MWFGNPHSNQMLHRPEVARFLSHELNFTDEQESKFKILREDHHSKVESLRDQNKNLHDEFFNLMNASPSDSSKALALADSIAALQKQIELITFYHFQQVRTICSPEQQKKFDTVINEALHMMAPKPPGEGRR